jgi:hypothetical protein
MKVEMQYDTDYYAYPPAPSSRRVPKTGESASVVRVLRIGIKRSKFDIIYNMKNKAD